MTPKRLRCAIYTRKSTDEGLEQDYNSLEAQRDACLSYVKSQSGEGWTALKAPYDDGGYSGGSMDRPALQKLLSDIRNGSVDVVVVYKVDRLSRSLADFAKIVETLDEQDVSFVSVTQQFNTTSSMGRLTLNVLLSFAQFEREVTAERIRDKIAASKKKGLWMGGVVPLGYDVVDRKLIVNQAEAETVRTLFQRYRDLGTVKALKDEADRLGLRTKARIPNNGGRSGGMPFRIGHLHKLLTNKIYLGKTTHKGQSYPGEHEAIIDLALWALVQDQLRQNTKQRTRSVYVRGSNLLTGLLFDEEGKRISPHYTNKQGRRYRYYISRDPDAKTQWRLPAPAVERAVIDGIVEFLRDTPRLINHIDPTTEETAAAIDAAAALAHQPVTGDASTLRSLILDLVNRIELTSSCVRVELDPTELMKRCLCESNGQITDKSIAIELPVTFKRRGVEMKLIINGQSDKPSKPDPALINVVTSAQRWFAQLKSGEVRSIKDLAARHSVDKGDVSRILPLAFLAPDIVEAILDGKHPVDLTAYRLKRIRSLPYDWQAQRELLGFA